MLEIGLILVATLGLSVNQVMTRTFQTKLKKSKNSINLYHLVLLYTAAIASFAIAFIRSSTFSLSLLLPAALFGLSMACSLLFLAKSMETGYMSLSTVIVSLSLVIPVVFSWAIGETPMMNEIIGLLLIIATLLLSSMSAGKGERGNIKKWLLFVSIAFLTNGGCTIIQKQYVISHGKRELMMFTAMFYLFAAIMFTAVYIKGNIKGTWALREHIEKPRLLLIVSVASGLGNFLANFVLGYLADIVPGGVLYPCVHGGRAVIVALCSFLIFKEKPSRRKIAAICIGVAAIIVLNIKF